MVSSGSGRDGSKLVPDWRCGWFCSGWRQSHPHRAGPLSTPPHGVIGRLEQLDFWDGEETP
jgi:hypothetical protein